MFKSHKIYSVNLFVWLVSNTLIRLFEFVFHTCV